MNNHWEGTTALITGASSGIGASIAYLLAAKGIHVILVARNATRLKNLVRSISENGGKADFIPADLTVEENRSSLYRKITEEFGTPEIIINNAGVGWYGYFSEMPWSLANNLLQLNIIAPTHLTSLFLPDMMKMNQGHIINIGSISGKLPEQGIVLYSSSKGYLDNFTKALYRELRQSKVSVSVIRAGPVQTNFFDSAAHSPGGRRIPAESLSIPAEQVARKVWSLLEHPRRFAYVPFYTIFSPLLEIFFSWAIDLVGPILLQKSDKKG